MQKKLTNETMKALLFFVLGLLFILPANATPVDTTNNNDCSETGLVLDVRGTDACEYVILLENGDILEPVEMLEYFEFSDSMLISFGYEYMDVATNCMMGTPVLITCITPIDDTADCWASFEYYQVDCDSVNSDHPCVGWNYRFIGYGPDNTSRWSWYIDGELFSHDSIATLHNLQAGNYNICLEIITNEGCEAEYCEVIIIDTTENCQAAFEYYPIDYYVNDSLPFDTVRPGIAYQFYDVSVGEVVRWKWRIDGELFSTEQNPVLNFTHGGEYEICLKISTKTGCESAYCENIYIDTMSGCIAMFGYYPLNNYYYTDEWRDTLSGQYLYQFEDYSIGGITYWFWEFGDGETSLEQNPVHEFPGPGEYEVCLFISSELDACNASYCTTVIVDSSGNCNAYFEYCSYSLANTDSADYNFKTWEDTIPGDERLLIGFKNLSTPNSSYLYWEFGDGSYSNESNPVHAYEEPGVYMVCLYIYSSYGCYDSYCEQIKVGIADCEVDFTYEIAVPDCDGFQIAHVFKPEFETNPYYVYWNFGDGEYSNQEEPIHIYSDFGTYEACVEVIYSNGCTAMECHQIITSQDSVNMSFAKNCGALPVNEREVNQSISVSSVYPLPATTRLNIRLTSEYQQQVKIELTNLLGTKTKVIDSYEIVGGENEIQLELDGLKSGIYIYTIYSKEKTIQGQITIIN